MTLQEAAKEALQVQDACNLSGVVKSFARVVDALWEEAQGAGQGLDEWRGYLQLHRQRVVSPYVRTS
jgi:hypothetical protein